MDSDNDSEVESALSAYDYYLDQLESLQSDAQGIRDSSKAILWVVSANVVLGLTVGFLTSLWEEC